MVLFRKKILEHGVITEEELQKEEAAIEQEIEDAVEYAKQAPFPANEDALINVFKAVSYTHLADCYSIQQQQEAVALGAYVEHSFFTTYHNRTPIEEIARQIRAVGCEHVLLTTDFGQLNSLYSDEGMEEYARVLMTQGLSLIHI